MTFFIRIQSIPTNPQKLWMGDFFNGEGVAVSLSAPLAVLHLSLSTIVYQMKFITNSFCLNHANAGEEGEWLRSLSLDLAFSYAKMTTLAAEYGFDSF